MGRVQPLLPQLLHVPLGQAEQQMPTMSTGLGGTEDWQVRIGALYPHFLRPLWHFSP